MHEIAIHKMTTLFRDLKPTRSRTIPYLTFHGWVHAFLGTTAQSFGTGTSIEDLVGPNRNQRWVESWLNLLLVLGAQDIISSPQIDKLNIDVASLSPDVTNPIAIQLSCLALLAGLAGCERLNINQELPAFEGETTNIQFIAGGPFGMIGKYSDTGLSPRYCNYSPRLIWSSTCISHGLLLWNAAVPIYMTEDHPEDEEGLSMVSENLRSNRCSCGAANIQIPTALSWLQRRVLALLVVDSPWSVRAFPYAKCQVTDAACQLVKLCPIWANTRREGTRLFGSRIELDSVSVGFIPIEEFRKKSFMGYKAEIRCVYLHLEGDEVLRAVNLGWSWFGSQEAYEFLFGSGSEFLQRPNWPADLSKADFNLIDGVIEACNSFLSGNMTLSSELWSDTGFFVTVVSTQLAEVDWWLGTHEVPLAACETCVLLNEIDGGLNNGGPLNQRRTTVRALLILRAVLVAMLCWDALDISLFIGSELGNQVVLLR